MIGLNIWRATAAFFQACFAPYDAFRKLNNNENWWTANIVNIILFLIAAALFVYFYGQLIKFSKNGTEDYK